MKAIIFGVKGQDGFYLTELLSQENVEIVGIDRSSNLNHPNIANFESVKELIQFHQPDYIFHFAANSTTNHGAWRENHETISTGTLNILEAVKQVAPSTKVFLSGSGLQFKNENRPIHEKNFFEATSMYTVSRIHMVYAARYYRSLGLKVYVGYFFNHDSPLRTERHINKRIAEAVKRIKNGSKEKLEVGNLSVKKEYGFAGDIVRAVWILIKQDNIFEAVIGTGVAHSIEDWVETCFSQCGLDWEEHVRIKEGFIPEYQILVSDPRLIFSLGWKPNVSMQELATMMIKQG